MNIPSITFPKEDTTYTTPSWKHLNELAFDISRQMIELDQSFDRIVTLAKGGWPMTRSLVDFLGVTEVASIGVKFYSGINKRLPKPEIYQDLPVTVKGERILLFDDVVDSGKSLMFVTKYLQAKRVGQITTAALFYKPHSKMKPDYYGARTSDWIIFPYDVAEGINVLGKKWSKAGIEEGEIRARFDKLGFGNELVRYYFKRC